MSVHAQDGTPVRALNEVWVDVLNQQAQRCADEISRRSSTQQAVEAGYYAATAAIAGLFLTGNSSPFILLLIPLLAFVSSRQWLDHHRTIHALGSYLSDRVERELETRLGRPEVAELVLWEGHIRRRRWAERGERPQPGWRDRATWLWVLPLLMLFAGVGAVVLIALFRVVWLDPLAGATHGLSEAGITFWPKLVWVVEVVLVVWVAQSLARGLLKPSEKDDR